MKATPCIVCCFLALVASGCSSEDVAAETAADAGGRGAAADADLAVRASVAPTLKVGVDPSIFLPTVVVGYHPTAEEIATSGRSCATDADCATSGGQVVFHCSTAYYGQSQCQGAFPPGDQVVPGVAPSCLYYDCAVGYECETEPESLSVACLADQNASGRPDGGGKGGH